MNSIYLSDLFPRAGIQANEVSLIRHPLNNEDVYRYYTSNKIKDYTAIQKHTRGLNRKYWLIFIGEKGRNAKLIDCYENKGYTSNHKNNMPSDCQCPEFFNEKGDGIFFSLKPCGLFDDLKNRLIIDWGTGTRSWSQYADRVQKSIIALQADIRKRFNGYEDIVLSYKELKDIYDDPIEFEEWHTALKSVYAIYLIVDTGNGKQYIGSAYGEGGLLERWKCYVDTKHGKNQGMIEVINKNSDRFHLFQFSILQILSKTTSAQDVIHLEQLYKRKLLSIEFGMNEN